MLLRIPIQDRYKEARNTEYGVESGIFASEKSKTENRHQMDKRRILQIIFHNRVLTIAIVLLTLLTTAIIIGLCLPAHEPTLQGQLETTDYRVATKVPSRVVRLRFAEGDRVRRGDTLVWLSAPEVVAKEQGVEAMQQAAEASDRLLKEGTRKEQISATYHRWQQAEAQAGICEKTYCRMENLYAQGVVAEQQRDEARAAHDAAVAQAEALHQQYQMALSGARHEERMASRARVRTAAGQTGMVKAYVDETVLTAPQDGVVTEVFVEPGEIVGSGAPIMNVETDEAWFTFYFTEDKLQGIDYGSLVRVWRPATGDTVVARITRINNAGNFATWKATRALEDLDLKVFDVRATPMRKTKSPHGGESAVLLK